MSKTQSNVIVRVISADGKFRELVGLRVIVDGKLVASGEYGGEPEDAIECRDYAWVKHAVADTARALGASVVVDTFDAFDADAFWGSANPANYTASVPTATTTDAHHDAQHARIIALEATVDRFSREMPAALARIEQLQTRQQELLATIVKLAQTTPFPDEAGQAAVLIAEVGTLRATVAERDRRIEQLQTHVTMLHDALEEACDDATSRERFYELRALAAGEVTP